MKKLIFSSLVVTILSVVITAHITSAAGSGIGNISPRGGEVYNVGAMVDITWEIQGPGIDSYTPVNIYYSQGAVRYLIVSQAVAQWYRWTIPNTLQSGPDYKIEMELSGPPGTYSSTQSGTFTIVNNTIYAHTTSLPEAIPSTYGLKDGALVGAQISGDPDIFIINERGYKRLFLNPIIFKFYGHLGGYAKVNNISATARDQFATSLYFRNCETNDPRIWALEATGEDSGTLHYINMSGEAASQQDANIFVKTFCINNNEFKWYQKGTDYISLSQVKNYNRE